MLDNRINFKIYICFSIVILLQSCSNAITGISVETDPNKIIFKEVVRITKPTILEKEVIIYPEALLIVSEDASITFKNKVTIIGESQVFNESANINFEDRTISKISPVHFGANGLDEKSDYKAIQKVFDLVANRQSAIEVFFPIGKYLVEETLQLKGARTGITVNLIGVSRSNSGTLGSSILWNGNNKKAPLLVIENLTESIIQNLDFNSEFGKRNMYNILIKPFTFQLLIDNCTFGGCEGNASANINLNDGQHTQVSEIKFNNCKFRGIKMENKLTENAIIGGRSNTKDFYIDGCSFAEYNSAAININATDVLNVMNCTFSNNDIDIYLGVGNGVFVSNYSEGSFAFFSSTKNGNISSFHLIGNTYCGIPKDGFAVRDGSGSLILLSNNFGGCNNEAYYFRVKWEDGPYDSILSYGNFYQNGASEIEVFLNRSNQKSNLKINTTSDLGGQNALLRIPFKNHK